ncbi:PREDICTED: ubiquitin-conjugating enzyme E2 U [Miniopterus natalensis]|uniref:ubiquitin-conjugating enzyme E2 U n=1 Tax=Miniopterus natalensis TaxID=291302 RepID=UPI0007A6AC60|nr:PREDICTED: ubiquitin-conjugating enzyme E2 U [Miniopterus natalensis]
MSHRAYFLLQRDFQELKENNYAGISAFPVSEDMMEWEADIEGLENTIWHGIFFQVTINFTVEYNLVPPVVIFRTIPFHPNVDQHTGRPCIDFLDNPHKWNRSYTLSSILLTLQVMLSNPVLENPVNLEAAHVLTEHESMYREIVQALFHEPLQLKDDSPELSKDSDKLIRSIKISFDDYFKTWSEIATSKAAECYRTPLLEDPSFIGQYHKWKKMELKHQKEWNLKYAAAFAQYARETNSSYKANYRARRIQPRPAPDPQTETEIVIKTHEAEEGWKSDSDHIDESWEDEVEDLVAWTNSLDAATLED